MNICLVSDFFHPKLGGVETHIYALGITLSEKGHKVIIMTHAYSNRQGVKYLTNGLKVYYLPYQPVIDAVILFTVIGTLPLVRQILIKENIHIVHSHSGTSYLGNEILLHAQLMGLKTIYTDHSLFSLNEGSSYHVNKILKFILSDIDHAISVSHVSKENLSLRASLNPENISVIPNALDCNKFKPDPSLRFPTNTINIVIITRMTYRKGVDLLIEIIPKILQQNDKAYFIIGGDGPKFKALQNMVDRYQLQNRVELLGGVPSHKVRDVLVRGHIFLNTSLTEAFCIAIVEAASCGLLVVSTNVGGIVEVLPQDLVKYAQPDSKELTQQLLNAIPLARNIQSFEIHQRVKQMYNWRNVAERTEQIYKKIIYQPNRSYLQKFRRATTNGPYFSIYVLIILIFDFMLLQLLDIFTIKKRK